MSRAGLAVAASRSDLAACLHPAPDSIRDHFAAHLEVITQQDAQPTAFDQYTALDHARRDRIHGPVALSEPEAAQLLSGLTDPNVRDACCCWGDPGWWLWLDLIPFAPPSHIPAVATLIALHAFQRGEGPMASIAAEHALAADPSYPLAQLILQLTHCGVRPDDVADQWKDIAALALNRVNKTRSERPERQRNQ